jgi:hypothetical protein
MTIGRMALLVQYNSRRLSSKITIEKLNEAVLWRSCDPWWFEIMEAAGLGFVENNRFRILLPPEWNWKIKGLKGYRARLKVGVDQKRDGKGKWSNG